MLPVLSCVILVEAGQWTEASACSILINFLHCNFLHENFCLFPGFHISTQYHHQHFLQWLLFSSSLFPCSDKTQVSLPSFLHGKHWVPSSPQFLSLTLLRALFFSLYLVFGFEKWLTACLRVEHSWVTCSSVHTYELQSWIIIVGDGGSNAWLLVSAPGV